LPRWWQAEQSLLRDCVCSVWQLSLNPANKTVKSVRELKKTLFRFAGRRARMLEWGKGIESAIFCQPRIRGATALSVIVRQQAWIRAALAYVNRSSWRAFLPDSIRI
jgi:hypothetical protein